MSQEQRGDQHACGEGHALHTHKASYSDPQRRLHIDLKNSTKDQEVLDKTKMCHGKARVRHMETLMATGGVERIEKKMNSHSFKI